MTFSRLYSSLSLLLIFSLSLNAQEDQWDGPSVSFSHGKLIVSGNKHFLQFEDGTPFFYLGGTAWELFHRLSTAEAEKYLENRRSKGFTVIQAVALGELDGIITPNVNGDFPFEGNDPLQPNETYFAHMDSVIRIAEQKGLFIGLLSTWGDKVDKQWGAGPVLFNIQNARQYGQWIGKRYKDFRNIIWINGGDRNCSGDYTSVWDALARGIKSADGNHLMTFHPWGGTSSSACFQDTDWLDFNMLQSGHSDRFIENYAMVADDYKRIPVKPCMDGEPNYEDHPINWDPANGWFDEWDVRRAAYQSVFAGGMGVTYGCHPVWQFFDRGRTPIAYVRHNWYEVLDLPGALDMLYLRRLIESKPFYSRVPDPEMIVADESGFTNKILACRGEGYGFVYLPANKGVRVRLDRVGANNKVLWYNPRNGKYIQTGTFSESEKYFSVPVRGIDWVLVIEVMPR